MEVDKDFTYDVIAELREYGGAADGEARMLTLGAANVMENNIRAYLDLLSSQQPHPADVKPA